MNATARSASGTTGDYLNILSGTSQNVVGIVVAALATFAAQIVLSRALGAEGFGVVTVATQAAFVASFATRAGMDMAVLRDVAIEAGVGRHERIRAPVARAVAIAGGVSLVVALVCAGAADSVSRLFSFSAGRGAWVVEAAALSLPFLALTNVWLSATRGLKIMRYTLYVFWAGQPLVWVLLMVVGLPLVQRTWMGALTYSLSWILASAAAWWFWHRTSREWPAAPLQPGQLGRLVRYAGPRAPAALFSQLLFWTDLFVLTRYASEAEVGVYAAALRAGQVLVLFLTSVSLMFSPFVADLHNRGETERLGRLFKAVTRWTLAATLPILIVLAIAPGTVLKVFGADFRSGYTALLILLAGQVFNVGTGSVGFVLIMAGRTGWDLCVCAAALVVSLTLAFLLCPSLRMEGAAIANALTFAFSNSTRLLLVRRFVGIQPYDRQYARLVVPALGALAAGWAVHSRGGPWLVDLILTAAAVVAAYAAAYLAIGLTPAERRGAAQVVARLRGRGAGPAASQ